MTDSPPTRNHYWLRNNNSNGRWVQPPGVDLAALRRGLGRETGTVPGMWAFYTTLTNSGRLTQQLVAEHVALTLFGVHQQSQSKPMHVADVGLGRAVRVLHAGKDGKKGKFSQEAVNRRFTAAATATSMPELTQHLRGLVSQLNNIGEPIDYTLLFRDLVAWQAPGEIGRIRRRWGSDYFDWQSNPAHPTKTSA
jgi:CRISPR system Cascade subunit CasB